MILVIDAWPSMVVFKTSVRMQRVNFVYLDKLIRCEKLNYEACVLSIVYSLTLWRRRNIMETSISSFVCDSLTTISKELTRSQYFLVITRTSWINITSVLHTYSDARRICFKSSTTWCRVARRERVNNLLEKGLIRLINISS